MSDQTNEPTNSNNNNNNNNIGSGSAMEDVKKPTPSYMRRAIENEEKKVKTTEGDVFNCSKQEAEAEVNIGKQDVMINKDSPSTHVTIIKRQVGHVVSEKYAEEMFDKDEVNPLWEMYHKDPVRLFRDLDTVEVAVKEHLINQMRISKIGFNMFYKRLHINVREAIEGKYIKWSLNSLYQAVCTVVDSVSSISPLTAMIKVTTKGALYDGKDISDLDVAIKKFMKIIESGEQDIRLMFLWLHLREEQKKLIEPHMIGADGISYEEAVNRVRVWEALQRQKVNVENITKVNAPSTKISANNEVAVMKVDSYSGNKFTVFTTKLKCFNCDRKGHFEKECRQPRNQSAITANREAYFATLANSNDKK